MKKHVKDTMERCIHFTGIQNDTCKAGLNYQDVKAPDAKPILLPCFKTDRWQAKNRPVPPCEKREFPTREQAEAEVAEHEVRLERFIREAIQGNRCLTHNIEITKVQVGPCVYAKECGCRLYQGTLK